MRRTRLLLALIVLAAVAIAAAGQALRSNDASIGIAQPSPIVRPPTGQSYHTLIIQPDDGVGPLLRTIEGARTSLEVKAYLLNEQSLINAMKAAAGRGVKTRVMLEQNPYGTGPGNGAAYSSLQAGGVSVKWANPAFRLTHEKSMVVDGRTAFILTFNLVNSAFSRNREYGIVTTDPAEVAEVLDGFEADWDRRRFTPPADSSLLWSTNNSRRKILAFIDSARQTLVLEQTEMQDRQIQDRLVAAVKRGVKVRVILASYPDDTGKDYNRAGALQLRNAGAAVRSIVSPIMHAKLYVADNTRAIIGSMNVAASAFESQRELGIMVSDPQIVQRIVQTVEKDWAAATDYK